MKIDDHNFIKEIKNGNTKALDFIIDHYSNLVFKIVGNVLNTGLYLQYIEECSNDVFLLVWNNIESLDEGKGNFKYWIAAISKYRAIDYKRRLFKQNNVSQKKKSLKIVQSFTLIRR
ncbi:sigma factor [Bacillus chungangensis]|uniref:DNA-directed RNA polymerase specialized sigma24 family protein n=1 Tax=Bacillus chungangensis TaxID=587633 RepID=A0ABT9WNZ6_9BACI|nr:sigma factor [Bacillus chungangensis]MDQ0174927.1 DNA-directed RNA polymerase specialized sigma24 family protein [Bacillus chungangensis]